MHLGENLKACREAIKMKQGELAERSGISTAQISRLERNEQNNPQVETLISLATALGVSIDKIVFGEENQKDINYMMKQLKELNNDDWEFCNKLIKTILISSEAKKLG